MDAPTVDAIARLVPAVLKALYALEFAGRHLAPQTLPRLIEAMAERPNDLGPALAQSRAIAWPERLQPARVGRVEVVHGAAAVRLPCVLIRTSAANEPSG